MRVLHLIESLGRGGAEQALVNLLPALVARGVEAEVATLWGPLDLAGELERRGIRVRNLALRHRWQAGRAVGRLARLVARGGFDVVHAHLFFSGFYSALSVPLIPGPKRVVTFHNLAYDSYPANTAWRRVRKAMDGFLLRRGMDGYLAVSAASGGHYRSHLGVPAPQVIPNAFPLGELERAARADRASVLDGFGVDPGRFVIVVPGRFVPEKGHRFLLRALATLAARGVRPAVVLVGSGPLLGETLEAIPRLGLEGIVTHRAAVPHAELMPLVGAADLFVMSSTHEGMALAPAEAMALGTPVLATAVGGLPELIEDGVSGVLVPSGEPDALADEMERLIGDDARRRSLAAAARARIAAHFSTEVVAARMDEFYRSLSAAPEGRA